MEKNSTTPASVNNAKVNNTVPPVPPTVPTKNERIAGTAKKVKNGDNSNLITGVVTGAATGVGALVGAVAGSFTANAINNHNTENPDDVIVTVITDPDEDQEQQEQEQEQEQEQQQEDEQHNEEEQHYEGHNSGNGSGNDTDVEFVSYERIDTENGDQIDLVVVSVNGEELGVVDCDLDGRADLLIADVDGDGVISEQEIIAIDDADIAMSQLMGNSNDCVYYTQTSTDPDYVNDANVDTFFA